jgi:hypothetical protein
MLGGYASTTKEITSSIKNKESGLLPFSNTL